MLTARMMRHGDEMTALTSAVLMLEYDLTHTLASELSEEPKLGRPAPGETGTLNALLPAEFFAQQDALVESAKRLAKAAQRRDDTLIVEAFGDVTKSCVGCHAAYLNAKANAPARPDETAPCNPEEACGANEGR